MLSFDRGCYFICRPIMIKIEFNIKNIALSVSPVAIATIDNTSDANIIPMPNERTYFFIVVFSFRGCVRNRSIYIAFIDYLKESSIEREGVVPLPSISHRQVTTASSLKTLMNTVSYDISLVVRGVSVA